MATNLKQNKLKPSTISSGGRNLQSQLGNYKTRFQAAGQNDPTDTRNWLEKALNLEKDQNVLFDIFEILDRPRNALFTAIDKELKGEGFLEGLKEGISGNTETSGKDLLVNSLGMEDEEGKLNTADVLGFGLDIVGDPTNWATFGGKSLADIGVDATSKLVKGVGRKADDLLMAGLKRADAKTLSNLTELATKEGFKNADDFLASFGKTVGDYAGRANKYMDFKSGLKDTFNQGKTLLGNLKFSRNKASGLNDFLSRTMQGYSDNLGETAYKYLINNLDETDELLKYTNDLAKLTDYVANKGTITDFVKNTDTDFTKLLKQRQNTIAEDILDVIESNRSTKINNRSALRELTKSGKFTGDEESVKAIKDLIESTANEAGTGSYTLGLDLASDRVKNLGNDINQADLEALLRQQSTLEIDPTLIKNYADSPEFANAFNNLDLNRSWEYNADEWTRIQDLKNNPEFMKLVSQNENAYKDIAQKIKETTGMDYSDIVNNPAYVRRARGTIDDVEMQINKLNTALDNPDLTDSQRNTIEDAINLLEKQRDKSTGGIGNAFSSREYAQPTVVANRQYDEARLKKIEDINNQIKNLEGKYSKNKKEALLAQKEELQAQKLDDLVTNPKIEKLKEKYSKISERLDNTSKKMTINRTKIDELKDKMDNDFITKMIDTQSDAFTKSLNKSINDINDINKKMSNLNKAVDKAVDETELTKLLNDYDKLEKRYTKAVNNIRKQYDIVDGTIDKNIQKGLSNHAKNLDRYQSRVEEITKLKRNVSDLAIKENEIKTQISQLTSNLDNKIKQINFDLTKIDEADDILIDNQIKALSTTKSILESKEGQTLFNRNFYAGIDDFINYAEYTNQSAQVFKDALTMGVFNDENVIKTADTIGKNPKGWKSIRGEELATRLNNLQNIISDSNPQKIIGSGKDAKSVRDWIETLKGNTYYMDERMYNLFKNISSKSLPQDTSTILNLADKANNLFKKFSVMTPGFQVRNYVGNSLNMYLSGMPASKIVGYQAKATKLLNGAEDVLKKYSKEGFEALSKDEQTTFNLLKQFYEGGFNKAGTRVQDLEALESSLKLGKKGPVNAVAKFNMNLNENADAMNRMALLMYANENPKYLAKLGAKNPIEAVKYALMDPSNMSEAEQKVLKRLIPFYTFTKQNLMFQASNMTKNIGRYKNVMRAINNMYDDLGEDSYYDYQKSSMQIPIPGATDDNGNQLFLKANLPLSDLGEWLENPLQRTAASLTPLIKAPVESTTGKSLFTGDDTAYNNMSNAFSKLGINNTGVTNAIDGAELILNNFGLQNVSTNLVRKVASILEGASGEKDAQQIWAEIFRSVLQNTNEENVALNNVYDDLELYQNEVSRLKKQGIDIPTIREITTSNKIKVNNLKKKRASSK